MNRLIAVALSIYGLALAVYPRPFRTLFAHEMQATFRMLLTDAARRGLLPCLGVIVRETTGVIRAALTERLRGPSTITVRTILHGWPIGLALIMVALVLTGTAPPLLVLYFILPLVIIVIWAGTRTSPSRHRLFGLLAMVISWPLLAFWVALVVEGWNLGLNATHMGGDVPALAQGYTSVLGSGLREIEYGYIVATTSAILCVARLRRSPAAAHAPFIFALSNLAVALAFIMFGIALTMVQPIGAAAPRRLVMELALQSQILRTSFAVMLIIALLCFQAWWPLARPRSDAGQATFRRNYYLLASLNAAVLFATPFMPWVMSPFPHDPPGSLVYLTGTFWQDTLEHMFIRDIVHDTLFTLGVGSIWLYASGTLLQLMSQRPHYASRICGLIGATYFVGWIMSAGTTGMGWGYWVCCVALLASWAIETTWFLGGSSSVIKQWRRAERMFAR